MQRGQCKSIRVVQIRRHLDAVIPPYTVFSYDLRRNSRFLPLYTDRIVKRHDGVNGNVHISEKHTEPKQTEAKQEHANHETQTKSTWGQSARRERSSAARLSMGGAHGTQG